MISLRSLVNGDSTCWCFKLLFMLSKKPRQIILRVLRCACFVIKFAKTLFVFVVVLSLIFTAAHSFDYSCSSVVRSISFLNLRWAAVKMKTNHPMFMRACGSCCRVFLSRFLSWRWFRFDPLLMVTPLVDVSKFSLCYQKTAPKKPWTFSRARIFELAMISLRSLVDGDSTCRCFKIFFMLSKNRPLLLNVLQLLLAGGSLVNLTVADFVTCVYW